MKITYKGFAKGEHIKAVKAFSQGNYKEASSLWTIIADKKPKDVLALKGLACCLFLDNREREARSYLEEAIEYAMTDPEIHNLLALTYLKEGQAQKAIEQILDAQDLSPSDLLTSTLNQIKKLKNPDLVKAMPLIPLIQITLPSVSLLSEKTKKKLMTLMPIALLVFFIGSLIFFYPDLRNWVTKLNIRNRGEISPATEVSIKGIRDIVNARENFRILLGEEVIVRKFEALKTAISEQQHNKAKILVNELLASNASLAVKERVGILESFIIDPSVDNIDYVPSYAEIAVAPAVYEGVMLRWQGTVANVHHQRRKKTTFDLLVNFVGQGQVEGIATVELEGMQELNNGDQITVIGPVLGLTEDNRIIMLGQKILNH